MGRALSHELPNLSNEQGVAAHSPILGITGWKNNGKTTLLVRLVEHWTRQGLVVSTIKHAHHSVDLDQPGKDSYRHREAGARETMLATSRRWMLVHEHRGDAEPPLEALLANMAPADLILIEGFKRDSHPKIEVHRAERGTPLLANEDMSVIALATDNDQPALVRTLPTLALDDIEAIATFASEHLELRQ